MREFRESCVGVSEKTLWLPTFLNVFRSPIILTPNLPMGIFDPLALFSMVPLVVTKGTDEVRIARGARRSVAKVDRCIWKDDRSRMVVAEKVPTW
jgi:hypothetical protein